MPAKNRIKKYVSGGYYHIYNRGIDKRSVFEDEEDFRVFEKLLSRYLTQVAPVSGPYKSDKPSVVKRKQEMSLLGQVELISYCLLTDHYHLLVRQRDKGGITKLVRRVVTSYVMYFNKKHKRHGPLFENVYRAIKLDDERQVVAVGRLIHLNPGKREKRRFGIVETVTGCSPQEYPYSSYSSYLGINTKDWVKCVYGDLSVDRYQKYVEMYNSEANVDVTRLMIDLDN